MVRCHTSKHVTELNRRIQNEKALTNNHNLPYNFADYLELVDGPLLRSCVRGIYALRVFMHPCASTGRAIRSDTRGSIPGNISPILERLNIEPKQWLST